MDATIRLDVRGIPELVWSLRAEMAAMLREEADGEADPRVARRLAAVAAAFEAGQRKDTDVT